MDGNDGPTRTAAELNGQQPPRLDAVLQETFKDEPDRLARLTRSSNFYDELKKLLPKS